VAGSRSVAALATPPRHVTYGLKISSDDSAPTISAHVSCFRSVHRTTSKTHFWELDILHLRNLQEARTRAACAQSTPCVVGEHAHVFTETVRSCKGRF